jgi:hypothetical protein
MTNSPFKFGPLLLTTTLTTNILNPPTTTGGVNGGTPNTYIILRHIRWVNRTALAATFSHWLGTTGTNTSGKEVLGLGFSVAANSAYDWVGYLKIKTTDFLVGGSDTASALVMEGEGEMGVEI